MARSTDSFFIRATQNIDSDGSFHEGAIDLGAYVDALGKSILRIHNIQVTYSDSAGKSTEVALNETGVAQWQLTTQSQPDVVLDSNRSLVSSGRVHMSNKNTASALASNVSDENGINLHEWTHGYLIAVESLYLGGAATSYFQEDVYVSLVMECTVETLSQSAAMSLALSQQ